MTTDYVPKKNSLIPILILGALFFIFGFVTWLNGTLIPYLKIACELHSDYQSYLVTSAFYISYFVTALPSSRILRRTGFKRGMMLGLMVMAVGALIFIPAALTRTYAVFLLGLFIIGTGLSILQTASNPYITILGSLESAAKRISIMGICNKVAGVLAPLFLGAIVLSDADQLTQKLPTLNIAEKTALLDSLAHRVIVPYIFIAVTLIALSLLIRFSSLPEVEEEDHGEVDSADSLAKHEGRSSVFQYPNLMLGVLSIFLYVGAEVIAGDTLPGYGQSQGLPLSVAKNLTSYTLAAMVIGYIIGILTIPKLIRQEKALAISAAAGIILSLTFQFVNGTLGIFLSKFEVHNWKPIIQFTQGPASIFFIALLGFANALMWPAIWPLAIRGLGRFTKTGSALLIMAIAGGALLPPLYGHLADVGSIGHQRAYLILIPCYLYILYYALRGHRVKRW